MASSKTKLTCYLCGANHPRVIRDRLRHGIKRNVLRCQHCGLIFLEPKAGKVSFYRRAYRQKHGPIMDKTLSSRELFEYNLPLQEPRIKQLAKWLKPKANVLDIGSSTGHFLYAIKERVAGVVGIELNLDNAEFTRKELGIKVYNQPLEQLKLPEDYFDLITIYHTFEHVADPLKFLQAVRRCLKPNGHLFIEVPNTNDALMSVFQVEKFTDFWFIEPHLFYYTPATLKRILGRAGFTGRFHTMQAFSLFNHLNWLINKEPQADWKAAANIPQLSIGGQHARVQRQVNQWLLKTDQAYRQLLEENQVGSMLTFIGTKK